MKIAGIILLVLQVMAIYGTISSGGSLPSGLTTLIGYFLPAICGVWLLIKANKKKAKKDNEQQANDPA